MKYLDINNAKEILGPEFSLIFDVINPIVHDLKLSKDAKILDVGTGKGRMAIILALNNYKVITGEPDNDNTEYAKQNWLENAKKVYIDSLIEYKPFNAEKMSFNDEMFDAIFILGALHHINDKISAFKEFIRILKSKGIIGIFEPTPKAIKRIRKRSPTHPDAVDPREYTKNLPLSVEIRENFLYNIFIFKKI